MRLVLELLELIRTGNGAVIGGKYIIEFILYIVSIFYPLRNPHSCCRLNCHFTLTQILFNSFLCIPFFMWDLLVNKLIKGSKDRTL